MRINAVGRMSPFQIIIEKLTSNLFQFDLGKIKICRKCSYVKLIILTVYFFYNVIKFEKIEEGEVGGERNKITFFHPFFFKEEK